MVRGAIAMAVMLVAQRSGATETMRIAIGSEVKLAHVAGQALLRGDDEEDGVFSALPGPDVTVSRRGRDLLIDGAVVGGSAVRFRNGGAIEVNGTKVRGDVVALVGRDGVQLVNVLALEDYLAGVLGSEMPKSFPLEALKAQAIAARTYALHKKLEQYGQPFHLGSSVISQVYGGLASEDARTREAVEATRGMVLTYQLQPVEAYFHASCGGKTENGVEALGRDLPYLKPVSCPCAKLPQAEWSLELGKRVEVLSRSATGRATRVQYDGKAMDAVTFRERVGYMKLKSLWFDVRGGTLSGHGFGHGAGMCQWGAKVLADQGLKFREILSHYYVGTELQTLY
ncbi:MAG: SpoIID/LytB domain-containing protein [Archangiaceae bacterium]|nr:SpoIID/LytB domain-containing protein [Archangiaceae bacterium]